jgi:hypothetical protein
MSEKHGKQLGNTVARKHTGAKPSGAAGPGNAASGASKKVTFGLGRGQFWIASDFDQTDPALIAAFEDEGDDDLLR